VNSCGHEMHIEMTFHGGLVSVTAAPGPFPSLVWWIKAGFVTGMSKADQRAAERGSYLSSRTRTGEVMGD
jgi:hypothetical protein